MCAFKITASAGDFVPGKRVDGKFKPYKPTHKKNIALTRSRWDSPSHGNTASKVEQAQATGLKINDFLAGGKPKRGKDLTKNQRVGLSKFWGY